MTSLFFSHKNSMKLLPHSNAVFGQLDSQAMVTQIWPQNKLSLIPFEVMCVYFFSRVLAKVLLIATAKADRNTG